MSINNNRKNKIYTVKIKLPFLQSITESRLRMYRQQFKHHNINIECKVVTKTNNYHHRYYRGNDRYNDYFDPLYILGY